METPEEILRKAREKKNLTQTQMAEAIGVGLRQYQKIEKGKFPKYKTEQFKKIDYVLGTNLYALIYEQSGAVNSTESSAGNTETKTETSLKLKSLYVQRFTTLH